MMTPEELLLPRYKVIADFPFNNYFKVGEILTLNEMDETISEYFVRKQTLDSKPNYSHTTGFHERYLEDYWHIFRKLNWWDERKDQDAPTYIKLMPNWTPISKSDIKFKQHYQVCKPYKIVFSDNLSHFYTSEAAYTKKEMHNLTIFLPATEKEFQDFINGKSK